MLAPTLSFAFEHGSFCCSVYQFWAHCFLESPSGSKSFWQRVQRGLVVYHKAQVVLRMFQSLCRAELTARVRYFKETLQLFFFITLNLLSLLLLLPTKCLVHTFRQLHIQSEYQHVSVTPSIQPYGFIFFVLLLSINTRAVIYSTLELTVSSATV